MAKNTTATAPAPTTKAERKIPLEKLRRGCNDLFGITPSTFDGATVGLEGSFTVEEMKAHIDKWLNTPVSLGRKKEA